MGATHTPGHMLSQICATGVFGVASLHRYELINNRRLFAETLERLRHAPHPVVFVDHPVTVAALRRFGPLRRPGHPANGKRHNVSGKGSKHLGRLTQT